MQDIQFNPQAIIDFMKDNNLSKKEFSRQCEITPDTLNGILNGRNFNIRTIRKMLKVMGDKATLLFIETW